MDNIKIKIAFFKEELLVVFSRTIEMCGYHYFLSDFEFTLLMAEEYCFKIKFVF